MRPPTTSLTTCEPWRVALAVVLLVAGLVACGDDGGESDDGGATTGSTTGGTTGGETAMGTPWTWDLPEGFPAPQIPEDNPMTVEKVELGRYLFYDPLLSVDESFSCASCHKQELAFTDGLPVGVGVTGQAHTVGPMSLTNAGYATTLGWANPLLDSLEKQALVPMFGEEPIELGLSAFSEEDLLDRFRDHPDYPARFEAAFPGAEEPITVTHIVQAIGAFERTLISGNSAYDRYTYQGEDDALTDSQRRGMFLFFSERVECFHCHGGFNFSDSTSHEGTVFTETPFHNNGLYNVGGTGRYPNNQGVYEITQDDADRGRFKAPTLRNIELTAPYMHDGSIATLEEVIDHYARGGRVITEGEDAGDGTQHPNKSEFVSGFILTEQEKDDLLNFLKSLTDEEFTSNPAYSDPFAD